MKKRNSMILALMAALTVLFGIGQAHAVDYRNMYRETMYDTQNTKYYNVQQTSVQGQMVTPSAAFRSTSAYAKTEWQESATPMLNADGSMAAENTNTYQPTVTDGPRRARPINPEPLGDAFLPLMLLAGAYVFSKYGLTKRKTRKISL